MILQETKVKCEICGKEYKSFSGMDYFSILEKYIKAKRFCEAKYSLDSTNITSGNS